MSRKRWRLSRAFRVLLACVALWLPARTASAWVAPVDTVVVATLATCAPIEANGMGADGGATRAAGRRVAERARARSSGSVHEHSRRSALRGPEDAATFAPAPPLYLMHCSLLR